jgi:enterochelin esterase-like enzyme
MPRTVVWSLPRCTTDLLSVAGSSGTGIALLALLVLGSAANAWAQRPAGPALVSPEVAADGKVTFRLKAADARGVTLSSGSLLNAIGQKAPLALVKDEAGVWSVTVGPVPPDLYDYAFVVDGVRNIDPANPQLKTGIRSTSSVVAVSGKEPLFCEQRDVPHGAVETVWYQSKVLGAPRRMTVYTPPGYASGTEKYPVLYLLHGSGDHDASWVEYGRVNFILDNLIAEKKARPMIVVMPNGHIPDGISAKSDLPGGLFGEELLKDIQPLAESRFRIQADREQRAMAGLSMGAGQTSSIGLTRLDLFSHIGLLSGGNRDFEKLHGKLLGNTDESNKLLKLLWIGRGKLEDPSVAQELSELLRERGIDHELHLSEFEHSWRTWRRDLYFELLPKLFK